MSQLDTDRNNSMQQPCVFVRLSLVSTRLPLHTALCSLPILTCPTEEVGPSPRWYCAELANRPPTLSPATEPPSRRGARCRIARGSGRCRSPLKGICMRGHAVDRWREGSGGIGPLASHSPVSLATIPAAIPRHLSAIGMRTGLQTMLRTGLQTMLRTGVQSRIGWCDRGEASWSRQGSNERRQQLAACHCQQKQT